MKTQTINPPIGGYFKHEEKVYRAAASTEYGCNGCCFLKRLESGTHFCKTPVSIDCSGKIIKDVTDSKELMNVELIDAPVEKRSIWPAVIFVVVFWTITILIFT